MQQSLIENILYSINEPLSNSDIFGLIKNEFHIEIDKFEFNESLNKLVAEGFLLKTKNDKYDLTDENKKKILNNVIENKDIESKRTERIIELLKEFHFELQEKEYKFIAKIFNEYIYECFLEYGRTAIKYFLPYNKDTDSNANILREKISLLETEVQKKAFTKLVTSYTDNLTKEELNYLENLAIKSEYFFSLGVPEETFNKSQDLKLNGLILLVDTNFIYSILGLHSHRQNESCNQIVSLISNKKIDCRLVFIRKTLEELKNAEIEFERTISSENLTYNQIKAMLDSDVLNSFSRSYFEKKIVDPDTPHPADKIHHSQKILAANKIQVYNYSFPHLENEKYLNAKFEEYYDYMNIKNEVRVKHGLPEKLQKSDKRLEHDIYLREAVITLRKDKNKINDINYICLTLDKGLIEFDRFANGRNAKGKNDIAPNFMLPSVFLRKIRPFIPMVTDDYKKAFINSITVNTIDITLPQYSEAVQRSITYFKKLGINDYDLIISIIKQELFFKEFIESEKNNKQEEFISSEINKAYEKLKKVTEITKEELLQEEEKRKNEIDNKEEKIRELKKEVAKIKEEYEKETNNLSEKIEIAKSEKESFERLHSEEQILLKEKLLTEKLLTINDLSKQKESIEKVAEKKHSHYKFWFCIICIAYFIVLAIITWKFGWDNMEPIIYFLGALGIIATYLYPAIMGKNINPISHFEKKKKDTLELKFSEFNFNLERYNTLLQEKEELEENIEKLKTAHNKKYGAYRN